MKFIKQFIFLFTLSFISFNVFSATSAEDQLRHYVASADKQDIDELVTVLHDDFVSTYTFVGKDKVIELNKKQFIEGFVSGKYGGNKRSYEVISAVESKNLVILNARFNGPVLQFTGVFIMQQIKGVWQLMKETLIVQALNN